METIFEMGKEILIAESPADTLQDLQETPEAERIAIGEHAWTRALAQHTAAHRASKLEGYVLERITLYSSFKN
nr:glycosyltransferase [Coleofasciculus sp. FACHB-542]